MEIFQSIARNREWLFSGIGVLILGGIGKVAYPWLKQLKNHFFPVVNEIKVQIVAIGLEKPTVAVQITNRTPSLSVVIHHVRVHYGNWDFSRYFELFPQCKTTLPPNDKLERQLSFKPLECRLGERTRQKSAPITKDPHAPPGIESPAQLFNAIGMGNANDSWIEIDFNEYEQREFLRGSVKEMFDLVGKQHRELRKNKAPAKG